MSIKEQVDKELHQLKLELSKLSTYTNELEKAKLTTENAAQLSHNIKDITQKISDSYANENQRLNELREELNKLVSKLSETNETISKIDFPSRLDKMDNTVSSINIGIQNIQSAIMNLDTKISKELESMETKMTNTFSEKLAEYSKSTKSLLILALVGLAILMGLIVFFNLS